jgi:hypothetical protein
MLATTVYDIRHTVYGIRYKVYDFMSDVVRKAPRGWSENCIRRSLLLPGTKFLTFRSLDLGSDHLMLAARS